VGITRASQVPTRDGSGCGQALPNHARIHPPAIRAGCRPLGGQQVADKTKLRALLRARPSLSQYAGGRVDRLIEAPLMASMPLQKEYGLQAFKPVQPR